MRQKILKVEARYTMLIRNLTDQDLKFRAHGKTYVFKARECTPIEDEKFSRLLKTHFGKYIALMKDEVLVGNVEETEIEETEIEETEIEDKVEEEILVKVEDVKVETEVENEATTDDETVEVKIESKSNPKKRGRKPRK